MDSRMFDEKNSGGGVESVDPGDTYYMMCSNFKFGRKEKA